MGSINEVAVMQSSVALLQERFKKLQRMKEKREQNELVLLKRLRQEQEEPKQLACSCVSPSGLFFHFLPAVAVAHRGRYRHGSGFECMEAPFLARSLPAVSETTCFLTPSLKRFHDWDLYDDHCVDTSLHL